MPWYEWTLVAATSAATFGAIVAAAGVIVGVGGFC